MSKHETPSTFSECGITSQFIRFFMVFLIIPIISMFIFLKFAPTNHFVLGSEVYKPFSGNVERASQYKGGLHVGSCAQDAVLADLRRMELNHTAALTYTGRDLLKMMTAPYSEDYKNPCWVDDVTNKLRCLPYFMLAGVAKAGTTNLYWSIAQHPQVRAPKQKEPQWWARRAYGTPLENYIKLFDKEAESIQREYKIYGGRRYHRLVTGDGSPATSYDFFRWKSITQNKNCTGEPGVVTPHLIRHIIPQAKIIFILRNPADRLLGGYIHWRKGKPTTPEHFHQQCVIILQQFNKCRKLHSDRHCTYNRELVSTERMKLQRSLYSVFIKDWLQVFPHEQMHFVQYEDFVQNKANVLKGVFKFLDLDPLNADDMKKTMTTKGINSHRFKMAPMLNKTRRMLEDFFKPYNEELSTLLGDPKFKFLNTQIPQNDPSGKNEVWRQRKNAQKNIRHHL